MNARWTHALLCAALALGACGDDDDPGLPLRLWPIPQAGVGAQLTDPNASMDGSLPDAAPFDASGWQRPPPRLTDDEDAGLWLGADEGIAVFDPHDVYVFGRLSTGDCTSAVAPAARLDVVIVGFECEARSDTAQIRPSDGRLLYGDSSTSIRVFHCDGCDPLGPGEDYPAMPAANDESLPGCGSRMRPAEFRVAADGTIIHRCNTAWFDADGYELKGLQAAEVLRIGNRRTVLTGGGVVDLEAMALRPFRGLPPTSGRDAATRVVEDGYRIAIPEALPATEFSLWHVGFDGAATAEGTFVPPSKGYEPLRSALDGHGRLVQLARVPSGSGSFRNAIVRLSLDAESEVLAVEGGDARVLLDGSSLFTGP